MKCQTCTHFLQGGVNGSSRPPSDLFRDDSVGLCRRYPPKWIPDPELEDGGIFGFPAIHQEHRCGEYEGQIPL